jgi:hypothetical protein
MILKKTQKSMKKKMQEKILLLCNILLWKKSNSMITNLKDDLYSVDQLALEKLI